MSWGGLPWWVYEAEMERHYALMSCAFLNEYQSGTSKVLPPHVIRMIHGKD